MRALVVGVVVLLNALLPAALAQQEQPWHRILHPGDLDAVENAEAQIAVAIRALPADAHGLDELPEIEALLSKKRLPCEAGELVGNWRVRSIQVGPLGVFSYPFFAARFAKQGGMTFFEKTTGSQRRSGFILPNGDHLVFVGGSTVNEDPQRPYSTLGGEREHDTIGKLVKIGPKELLILLDPSPTRFEIYHLKRR